MGRDQTILEEELYGCFRFFWEKANAKPNSRGYGLMVDRDDKPEIASIAAVGFALSAYVIGVKRGWVSYARALERVKGTLKTLYQYVPHYDGFFAHFCNMETAERIDNCEFSTIDTALAINGVITVDAFFLDADVHQLSDALMKRVSWEKLVFERDGKLFFRMAYHDNPKGNYAWGKQGYFGAWDMCAEQLMMYLQAAMHHSISESTAQRLYLGFDRPRGEYDGYTCIYEPGGTLFVYQYSQAWFDFTRYCGCDGINWAENSVYATRAQISWCRDHGGLYVGFREGLWGMTASATKDGYCVLGGVPSARGVLTDGTIAPNAMAGSLVFTFEESCQGLDKLKKLVPNMIGAYGFYDSCNLDEGWIAKCYLGIDKGISMLMISNALYSDIYDVYMAHPAVTKAIDKLGMKQILS